MTERLSDAQRRRLAGALSSASIPDTPSGSSPGEVAMMAAGMLAGPFGARVAAQYGPKAIAAILGGATAIAPTEASPQSALTRNQKRQIEMEQRRKELETEATNKNADASTDRELRAAAARAEQDRINERLKREYDEQIKKEDANKTFTQKYPGLADALPGLGLIIGTAVPAVGKVLSQRNRNAPMRDWHATVRETEDALAAKSWTGQPRPNVAAAGDGVAKLDSFNAKYPKGEVPAPRDLPVYMPSKGMVASGMFGGSVAAESAMFPDQWNAINLPDDHPQKSKSREAAMNPLNYIERGVMGGLSGASGYKAGAMMYPDIKGPINRSEGLVSRYGTGAPDDVRRTMLTDAETQRLLAGAAGARPTPGASSGGGSPIPGGAAGAGQQVAPPVLLPPANQPPAAVASSNRRGPFPLTVEEEKLLREMIARQLMQP